VYLVPAFTDSAARLGRLRARHHVGLSRGTTRAHIARAALESIAFQSAEVLLAMQRDARQPLVELRVDGGATANDLMMQFQADLLGGRWCAEGHGDHRARRRVSRRACRGILGSTDEVAANWQVDRRFEPAMRAMPPRRACGRGARGRAVARVARGGLARADSLRCRSAPLLSRPKIAALQRRQRLIGGRSPYVGETHDFFGCIFAGTRQSFRGMAIGRRIGKRVSPNPGMQRTRCARR